ncbi:MAG: extracellular solute-binding protein [Chloroflexota bacterium]
MKKSWIVLIALFVVSVAVAANVAAQDTALSGVVRVGSWESGDALEHWNTVIDAYQAANPGVTVELEAVPDNYGTKLLAELASGTAPDVFMSGDGDVSKWVALGAAENLDPYIDGPNGFDRDSLFPAVAAFGEVNGSTYYLTKDYSPLVIYYNIDQFNDAGVALPTADWTWADMVAAAKTLTMDANGNNADSPDFDPSSIQRWGIQMQNTWDRALEPIIYANGGSMIAADGSSFDGAMNSEATVNAVQAYSDLYLVDHVTPTNTDVQSFSGTDLFQSGLVSMLWTGVWPLNGYKDVEGLNFSTVSLPSGSAGNANVLCWSGFALYSGSQNKDAAWDFLKFIATGDGAAEFANYAWTPVVAVADAQGLSDDPLTSSIVADLANLQPIPDQLSQYWGECGSAAFVPALTTILENGMAVQEAMDSAASTADACLAEKMAEAPAS